MSRVMKRSIAMLLALVMVIGFMPASALAKEKTSTVAKTQKKVNKALTNKKINKLIIKSSKKKTFKIKPNLVTNKKTDKKEEIRYEKGLMVNAPKATIVKGGFFRYARIISAKKIVVTSRKGSLRIEDDSLTVEVDKDNKALRLKSKGKSLTVAPAKGTKSSQVNPVVITSSCKNGTIRLSVPAKATIEQNATVIFREGSEDSDVAMEEGTTVKFVNQTKQDITVTDGDGNDVVIAAGTELVVPVVKESASPSASPVVSSTPIVTPSVSPKIEPSVAPSVAPSVEPSIEPSVEPSVSPSTDPEPSDEPDLSYDGYTKVWEDEFEGTEVNNDSWNVVVQETSSVQGEIQKYKDSVDNVKVRDGNLIISTLQTWPTETPVITSGNINTKDMHEYDYGIYAVRAKLPRSKSFHPYVKLVNSEVSSQEIDIVEGKGSEASKVYFGFDDGITLVKYKWTTQFVDTTVDEEYHEYVVERLPGTIKYYVDGMLTKEINEGGDEFPPSLYGTFNINIGLSVGGEWDGSYDNTTVFGDDSALIIDYVKVYRRDDYLID